MSVALTDYEKAMADGTQGDAIAAAMAVLIRYGEILGAERLVETDNVCGANIFGPRHSNVLGTTDPQSLFSRFSLNSERKLEVPQVRAHSCQLIGPRDPREWPRQGLTKESNEHISESEQYLAKLGVNLLNTCTPYQVGNVPKLNEHCAWMESSAVVFINSVLGARTNTEGRESAAAAMLTQRVPYSGLHIVENRRATHRVRIEQGVTSTFDWNVLGYWLGSVVGEGIPVLDGAGLEPDPVSLKQFGAAAASSGDIEMYHIPGVTPEAGSVEEAVGSGRIVEELVFGPREFTQTVERLNVTAPGTAEVDFVMIGCPHASLSQVREVARMLEGRRISESTVLWVFTPGALRDEADGEGLTATIECAGGVVMSGTCPAIGQFVPPGTRSFATDSAKQVHYLPAIMGVKGRFGTTRSCIDAALTGAWNG